MAIPSSDNKWITTHICGHCLGDRTDGRLCGCYCRGCKLPLGECTTGCERVCLECGKLLLQCQCDDIDIDPGEPWCSHCQGPCKHDDYPTHTAPDYKPPICETHKPSEKVDPNCVECERLACEEEEKDRAKAIEWARKERVKTT